MTSLTFYGGVREIGGNKILLEGGDARVFFDFGQSFDFGKKWFIDWLQPRQNTGLKDYFEFGLMPRIPGLYSKENLGPTDLLYKEPEFDGIFLSHAHMDHVDHIKFADPKIPIHCGEATEAFIKAHEATSPFASYGAHEYRTFRTGKKIKVHGLEVVPVHVDHSIPGAYAYIIHAPDLTLAYTGDFRLHGPKSGLSADFIKSAAEEKIDVLISEGTRMAPAETRQNFTEQKVSEIVDGTIGAQKKLVVTTCYSRDLTGSRPTTMRQKSTEGHTSSCRGWPT
ncbi:MAG: MBL fold metallo-hydrolase [archaeon]